MERLWSFRTQNFRVILECEEERWPDLSWDEDGTVRDKIERGEWQCLTYCVRVLFRGETIARDYIGNSIHADPLEFIDHRGAKARYGSYFRDMVSNVISQARGHLEGIPKIRKNNC